MKLELIKRENPQNRDVAKFYPHVVNESVAELKDLAKQIEFKREMRDISFEVTGDNP